MGSIRHLHIRNYRSVGSDWIDIEFPRGGPLVLLGPNNAGKSNIVSSLELVLGEGWPGSHQPEPHEFHGRATEAVPMEIIIDVEDVWDATLGDVNQMVWRLPPEDEEDNRPVSFNALSAGGKSKWMTNAIREQCYCMVIGADRRLSYQLSYTSKWTLLSKLMRRFHTELMQDEDRVQRLRGLFDDIVATFKEVEPFSEFSSGLKHHAAELGASLEYGLEIDFSAYDPSNFFHSLRVRPSSGGEQRSFEEIGTGQEQILAIAFAYAYAQHFGAGAAEGLLLVIEEPEAHLHPLAQRWLGRRIRDLAETGVQVIVTTHSPAFVSIDHADGLVLVRKKGEGQPTGITQLSAQALADYCREHGAGDSTSAARVFPFYSASATDEIASGVFARACVLVEGPTESLGLPSVLEKKGLDLTAEGIALISVGGIGSIPRWWRFFTAYGIPVYVIFDSDSKDDASGSHRADVLRTIGCESSDFDAAIAGQPLAVTNTYSVFTKDFEHAMRALFPTQYPDLEARAIERVGTTKQLKARYACQRLKIDHDGDGWARFGDLADILRVLSSR